ncbi:cytokine receptor common subunit beta isoform X1 [Hippoglossus hippoglossus]|uniref:cytokine receptor common subunit beta isoform X1 n=1 Tax=Hippoglossus hippoglossus TaxID=8267 RepID=UPI00148BD162|nr:cytokine receptor common subunit beta isoform X1 [Hippoglossus hippoglossus]
MPLLWAVLWSALPLLVLPSGPDRCSVRESSSSPNESPLLESLSCHNDYESFVHCRWRKHGDTSPQLWFQTENKRKLCEPYSPPGPDEPGTVQCRYETRAFSIGGKHTVFFLENETQTVCSSVPHKPLDLSQHLRARPPADLSAHDPGDGGRWLSWSSPYSSSSSSSWIGNLSYQLSYRPEQHDHWTTEEVTNTSVKLERQLLLPGRRYDARVRARASVGQWSSWSPVVTWKTEEDTRQFPSLHCVLHGEKEVMCSWEVSRELAPFISYQLACRRRHTAVSERCCMNTTVSSEGSSTALRYSCSLTSTDPAHLLLELLPTHTARTFEAYQHIRPNPPRQLRVKEKDNKWIVEWTEPSTASKLKLSYQVCYHRTQDQKCSTPLNISEGSTSLTIQGASLAPSQLHQVKVRSLVAPGDGSRYEGIPSEWTDPVDWTSHAGTWSLTTLIYVLIGVFAVTVFFTLYCTIPACQRRVILWVESVPSPHKSNILCEIKCVTSWTLQTEDTSICKVLLDNTSECSSLDSLVPITTVNEKLLEPDEGFWNSDDLSSPAEKMSFSGPYIFCKGSEPGHKSEEVECLEKDDRTSSEDFPPPVKFTQNGDGYVSLPNRGVSRSTQDLVSNSVVNTSTHGQDSVEQDPQRADTTPGSDKPDLSEATSKEPPPGYTRGPFTPWPQGGSVQPSGYCHLPQHT